MKRLAYISLTFATLLPLAIACTSTADSDVQQADTLPGIINNVDSLRNVDSLKNTVTGIAVDGASRTVYVAVDQDTFDFELPLDIDLHWQIGDRLSVTFVKTEEGDSVIYACQADK